MNFNEICKAIKEVRIQGAESIALAGVKALKFKNASVKKLLSLRPTEPLLRNSLTAAKKFNQQFVLDHFKNARKKYIGYGKKLIKSGFVIFTHCHSSSVVSILKEAKKEGKRFEVFNTETRPLYQGRITARELARAGIKVTNIVDAAAGIALRKTSILKKTSLMLIGCDAMLSDGSVINKVGSGMFAEIAYHHHIPVYVVGNSWKFSKRKIKIEIRGYEEIWKRTHANIKIKNPAFEVVDSKYITAIISELGILKPKQFVKKVKKKYPWLR